MGKITLTSEIKSVLSQLSEKTELVDENGVTLGLFTPKKQADVELYQQLISRIDPEELERRKLETGAVTYEEALKHLKSLGTPQ